MVQAEVSSPALSGSSRPHRWPFRAISLFLVALFHFAAISAAAQTQQYVYVAGVSRISGFAKNGQTGALTPTPGSPYALRFNPTKLALGATGQFLLALNADSNAISVYQIDAGTGAIAEVPNSPFAAQGQNTPQAFAISRAGNFLFVGSTSVSGFNATGSINTYSVDPPSRSLIPSSNSPASNPPDPAAFVIDPNGRNLYTLEFENLTSGDLSANVRAFTVDPATGNLFFLTADLQGDVGRSLALDSKSRFLFAGRGQFAGFIDTYLISPGDGSLTPSAQPPAQLPSGIFPGGLFPEIGGQFLYASLGSNGTRIYAIDQNSGVLTDVTVAGTPAIDPVATAIDPTGSYLYTFGAGGIHTYQINATTGALAEIVASPVTLTGNAASLVITSTAVQPVVGPVAVLTPPALEFGNVVLSNTGPTQVVHLTNTGDQSLAINGIAITGAASGDFSQVNNCGPTLPSNAFCSLSVTFTPSAAGARQATLAVADNAPGSPHPLPLHGTGQVPNPAATLSFSKIEFGSTPVSMTAGPNSVTLTNSGQTPLHISNIALAGSNAGDYSQTNACPATLLTTLSCAINVAFLPTALSDRVATVVFTDDAADSPQTIALHGMGIAPFTVAAGSSATAATVNPGQMAQYSLTVNPVPHFQGTVAFTCAGAPANAACQVSPPTLPISATGSTSAIPVAVMVTTMAPSSALAFPAAALQKLSPRGFGILPIVGALFALPLIARKNRVVWRRVVAEVAVLVVLGLAGCGGGSYNAAPANFAGTPAGTSTLIVTAAYGNVTQQIQLTLIVK